MKFYDPKYKQLDLGLLRSSLDELDKTNRWEALGDLLPWTELEKEYSSRLDNRKKGAGNKPARMILGAMIIKHKLNLSDAEMRHPVDVDIIHDGCRKVTDYIMKVCEMFELHKPRTNYKHARQAYLQLVKKAKKKGRMVRETIGVMLNYLRKDIRILMDLLTKNKTYYESLFLYEKRTLTAILKMYHQQEGMYRSKTHTCADRILSIFQPHVRAIVRGKTKARTEFGAKIGTSIVEGYTFIDHHSWDAYNREPGHLATDSTFQRTLRLPSGHHPCG